MDRATFIREKVFAMLSGFSFEGVDIPVFDEFVNPAISIPSVKGSNECYIIFQDQTEGYNETQTVCNPRFNLNLTVSVITVWGKIGSKKLCEDIADELINIFRDERGESKINDIKEIELLTAQSIAEYSDSAISFSKVLILNFIKNG